MFKKRNRSEENFISNVDGKKIKKSNRDFKKITIGFSEEEFKLLSELSMETNRSKLGCIREGLKLLAKKEK